MNSHPINDLMADTMQKIKDLVDVNTIVGTPITTPDGIMLIPISKVTFGFAAGGADANQGKSTENSVNFGGGSGAGASIVPVAFLMVQGESVKMIPVATPANTTVDRAIELVPQVIDRVDDMIKRKKKDAE